MKILNKLIRNIAKRWAIKHKSAIAHKTSTDPIKYYTEQIRTTSNNHAEKSSNNNLQPDSAMKYQLKVINRPNHVPLLNDGSHRHTRIRSEKHSICLICYHSTNLNVEQVVEKIIEIIKQKA